ncbi:hypothetical protein MMYC01_208905 [Madurella mycetomatis]|uniref:Uncharacterized protein n=1 Tax=Madurella mycetomatis TaxID=100816 RepID=A0A175VTN3_9PEZI|nr:hypothetical protein MMYC01_208905 [Madurella mycetomatis]
MERRAVARPLTICARSSETTESQSSLEVNVSEHSAEWDLDQSLLGELQQMHYPGSRVLAATPPPERALMSNQLVDGIGCHFPAVLPTRCSSLTLGNEGATDTPATPHHVPETTGTADVCREVAREADSLNTPGPTTPFSETPTRPAPCKRRMFGPANPLTPSPTPKRKRNPSPPFAPCPVKRQRTLELETGEQLEIESYPQADFQEPAANQALCTIRQLTISLAGSTGHAVDKPADEFSRDGQNLADSHMTSQRAPTGSLTGQHASEPKYAIEIECFSEDEIEGQLAELLSAYRAFYLEPDETEAESPRNAESGRRGRRTLKAIFENHLHSAAEEGLLLEGEEEDVLDMFMLWLREMGIPAGIRSETFNDMSECFGRLDELAVEPFIKKIV